MTLQYTCDVYRCFLWVQKCVRMYICEHYIIYAYIQARGAPTTGEGRNQRNVEWKTDRESGLDWKLTLDRMDITEKELWSQVKVMK